MSKVKDLTLHHVEMSNNLICLNKACAHFE